jgi:hypothetical protein
VIKEVNARFADPSTPQPRWVDSFNYPGAAPIAYNLLAFSRDGNVYWRVEQAGVDGAERVVAAGWLIYRTKPTRVLAEARAGVQTKHRRHGIYSWVLKSIRKSFRRPILSDRQLSAANLALWKKVGVLDEATGRYKLNPRPWWMESLFQSFLAVDGELPMPKEPRK